MALYAWRGRNNRGEAVTGELEAMTEGGVADQLLAIGVAPVHIALSANAPQNANQGAGGAQDWWTRLNRKPVVDEDLMMFSRQMYTLNKAGVPILRAGSEEFRAQYDKVIKPHDYETKLAIMEWLPVTSLMSKEQFSEYLDTVIREYSKQGISILMPGEES